MLLDIDNFKDVNDRLGHVMGDQILALVGGIIGDSARKGDVVCRYGGEEFALLLPNASSQTAELVGRRVMECIESADISVGRDDGFLTLSVGFTTLKSGQQTSIEHLIELADQALYKAKNCGRNQLRMWTQDI